MRSSAVIHFCWLAIVGSTVACSVEDADGGAIRWGEDSQPIVDVAQTAVERQSIGNCWVYAHASWAESMHKKATGEDFDISQSYWTYLHWFGQIVSGSGISAKGEIQTGGGWSQLKGIAAKYGLMAEADFVAEDANAEMSTRQREAQNAIQDQLKEGGTLATPESRRDPRQVRAALDAAWQLTADVQAQLDAVFGKGLERTFLTGALPGSSAIVPPAGFTVAYTRSGAAAKRTDLRTAFKEWKMAFYPSTAAERRALLVRMQRAAHAQEPVLVSWYVDFNALGYEPAGSLSGSFNRTTLDAAASPGRQGGHLTVLEDYEAVLGDATTTLKAGETLDPAKPEDQAKLAAALDPSTRITFLRVKNSWGADRMGLPFAPFSEKGYHDLYMDYLDGPIARKVDEGCENDCATIDTTPLSYFILPPGY